MAQLTDKTTEISKEIQNQKIFEKNLENENKNKEEKPKNNNISKPILNHINSQNKGGNIFTEIQQCLLFGPPNFSQNFFASKV